MWPTGHGRDSQMDRSSPKLLSQTVVLQTRKRGKGDLMKKWTPNEEKTLTKLIGEGKTYKEIATIMNKAKNSIIGKANRLNLKYLAVKEKPPVCKPVVVKQRVHKPQYTPILSDAPKSLNLTVQDLEKDNCRFIAGDDRLFCGHKIVEGTSYCQYHKQLCFIPLQQTAKG